MGLKRNSGVQPLGFFFPRLIGHKLDSLKTFKTEFPLGSGPVSPSELAALRIKSIDFLDLT
jgi:hypothetical protein